MELLIPAYTCCALSSGSNHASWQSQAQVMISHQLSLRAGAHPSLAQLSSAQHTALLRH